MADLQDFNSEFYIFFSGVSSTLFTSNVLPLPGTRKIVYSLQDFYPFSKIWFYWLLNTNKAISTNLFC